MKLPIYCIVGILPVKATKAGWFGMEVSAINWQTGEFQRAMEYLDSIILGGDDVEFVTKEQFNQEVEKIRTEISNRK